MLPTIPGPDRLWRPFRLLMWIVLSVMIASAVLHFIVEFWFLDSLGRARVFVTNFLTQLLLFSFGGGLVFLVTAIPIRHYAVSTQLRKAAIHVGSWLGLFAGWMLAQRYQAFLLAFGGGRFGETDPLFGLDVGFFVFDLPALRISLALVISCGVIGCLAALIGRYDQLSSTGVLGREKPFRWSHLAAMVTTGFNLSALALGLGLAARTLLARYGLLFADNEASGVRVGAEYVDVEGVFSTLNLIYVSTAVELGLVAAIGFSLLRVGQFANPSREEATSGPTPPQAFSLRLPAVVIVALLSVELVFFCSVVVRDHVFVAPNEPSIQLPYIQRHMDATLRGYRLEGVRTIPWILPEEPLTAEELLASRTVQNAPVLPGWVSHLEEPPDVQHFERIQATESTLVYGPMLQIYEQEQQLRPYYEFISVDAVRYTVGGERRMYVSAVRELPSVAFSGAQEWLRYWGSAALMYTHGMGLVMSPVNELDPEGSPVYSVRDVPPTASDPMFDVEPRVYFGEGARDDYILTQVRGLREFDYATSQFRTEYTYPADAPDGIRVDSWFRRMVFALYTGDVTAFLFSRFIDHDRTRVHIHRTPMSRVGRVAPFLFLESNIYAFAADGRILWMVNGLTTTDNYPYAFREVLGDKADERAVESFPERRINYAEDAVKVTVDAFSGEVHLYRISDDPIVEAWARVYPTLFESGSSMPSAVEAQMTYPPQWFHIQFDDIYKRYHQRHPLEFYNVEDLWDDADEVLGSIGRGLTEFGTTDQMTFSYEGYNLLVDPADLPPGWSEAPSEELQFALLMPFTPDGARNLRAVVLAFQDPGHYGELLNLRIPQGQFIPGPEQADAYIDADAQVNQQITLWVRHGSEVVRGHTLLLPVRGDILYVEPLWIVSLQNQLPQIKLFSVVYHGRTTMATSLSDAIRLLEVSESDEQRANELPWFRESGGAVGSATSDGTSR